MNRIMANVREFLAPHVPAEIRDDYICLTAAQLQKQARLLFGALLLTTPTAGLAASPGASAWIRLGVPIAMAVFCLIGLLSMQRDLGLVGNVQRSRRLLREATVTSGLIAMMCSAWCVHSWLGAPPEMRIYYPVIIALGAFSTAYCLSSVRIAAIANIVINIAPMTVLLLTSGQRMDLAVAVSLLVAAAFQLHMIVQHQAAVVRLLELQRQSRELALTDPLTGLHNRRALLDTALGLAGEGEQRLMLIDIDQFKAINDAHGHDIGDAVLVRIAGLLAERVALRGSVARIGGEEFAVLGPAQDLPEPLALALLEDIRRAAMPHGHQVTVSIGLAHAKIADESDWRRLFNRADAALYAAKAEGRNRIASAPSAIAEADALLAPAA